MKQRYAKNGSFNSSWIIGIVIVLKPIYLFPSGSLQICDYFFAIAIIAWVISNKGRIIIPKSFIKYFTALILICIYQVVINGIWSIVLQRNIMRVNLYYIYNFVVFASCLLIAYEVGFERLKKAVTDSCLISVFISFIGSLLTSQSVRNSGLFNNPNQLGYHGLLIVSIIAVFSQERFDKKDIITIAISVWIIIISGSKAAIIGVAVLLFFHIFYANRNAGLKVAFKKALVLVVFFTLIYFLLFSELKIFTSNSTIAFTRKRLILMFNEGDSNLGSGRGYNRVFELGGNFLWGMGEGAYDRFESLKGLEIHSSFISLLVSYGIFGFLLYVIFFTRAIRFSGTPIKSVLFSSGVILYSISHNGVRNSLLWMFVAYLILEGCRNTPNSIIEDKLLHEQ